MIKFNPTLFCFTLTLGLLTILLSCNGLNKPKKSNKIEPANSIGKKVSKTEEGILVIFQDSKNNYWFGGREGGVYKYNTKDLVNYSMRDGLCSNYILGIQEDKWGNIFFDTPDGVSKYDGQNFTTLEIVGSTPPKQNEWKLETDDLWFRMGWGKNGPYRYDGNFLYPLEFPHTNLAEEFYRKYPNSAYSPYGIYSMYKDSKGKLWFGTASLGVCRYDGTTLSWLYEEHLTKTPSGGDFGIRSMIEDKDGLFWFCNSQHRFEIKAESIDSLGESFIVYKKKDGVDKQPSDNENNILYFVSIAEGSTGDLWMATYDNGVWRNNGDELIHYPIKDGNINILLFSIYTDRQGHLWLGTQNAGVYKFEGNKFVKFKP